MIASAGLAIASTTASASASATTPARAKSGAHCVAHVSTHTTTCYDTFREAIADATDGRVTDAPAAPEKAAKDKAFVAELNAPAPASAGARATMNTQGGVVGAVFYWDWNYGGASWTMEIPERCKDNGTWDWGYTDLSGWNDAISSVIPANNCWVALYSDIYYNGTNQLYTNSTPYVGDAMNDRASSVQLT
ncbi:peptidase inhibitor family I36 protein [Streptomyces sp. NPDC017868]|uniref:peptidase inhibitor family I36 protein n=1 Tax=Streptomyces sp. NPDC017868 TaxID=3365014 RepID=UPI0037AA5ABF